MRTRSRLAGRARSFIRTHFDSPDGCSTSHVAGHLGVSRSLLCHRYRAAFGITVGQEIRRLRIDEARVRLAADPCRLIKEIAAEVGFMRSSYRTFLNAFRAETGMSPSEFQRRQALRGTGPRRRKARNGNSAAGSRATPVDGRR